MPTSDAALRMTDEPFFDRTAELALVDRWLDLASDGAPRIGVLRGVPGVGKSRFVKEAAERARQRGFRVLRGNGFEGTPPSSPS